tara:strand:+ start:7742 stop:7996 length:255 start_codon:yes stop_codon:yes gene_type:complete
MAESVDATDLKSVDLRSCRFKSGCPHHFPDIFFENENRSCESISGKIVLDLPHAAQRLRPGGQSPTAGLPLYGFKLVMFDRAQG